MKRIRGLDKWLTDDEDHQNWVWDELIKIKYMPSNVEDRRDFKIVLEEALNKLAYTPNGPNLISEMRKRWSRKKFNDNKNNKSTSVTLSPSSLKQLDYLAQGKTRRQVLEELLAHGAGFNKELAKQYKDLLNDNRLQFRHTESLFIARQKNLEATIKRKDAEIKKLRAEVKHLTPKNLNQYL